MVALVSLENHSKRGTLEKRRAPQTGSWGKGNPWHLSHLAQEPAVQTDIDRWPRDSSACSGKARGERLRFTFWSL